MRFMKGLVLCKKNCNFAPTVEYHSIVTADIYKKTPQNKQDFSHN